MVRWYGARMLDALRVLCKLDFVVEGLENIPSQPHVSYWKHSSSWEVFAQFLIGPPKVIVLKRELIYIPFFGWGLILLRSVAVDRGAGASAVNQVVAQGHARLDEGLSMLIFPEGTRMAAGQTRRYGVSGALLASRTGRAGSPRCRLLLAAPGIDETPRHHPRHHRTANRYDGSRTPRHQRTGASLGRGGRRANPKRKSRARYPLQRGRSVARLSRCRLVRPDLLGRQAHQLVRKHQPLLRGMHVVVWHEPAAIS
jgi:hypothetical protein